MPQGRTGTGASLLITHRGRFDLEIKIYVGFEVPTLYARNRDWLVVKFVATRGMKSLGLSYPVKWIGDRLASDPCHQLGKTLRAIGIKAAPRLTCR